MDLVLSLSFCQRKRQRECCCGIKKSSKTKHTVRNVRSYFAGAWSLGPMNRTYHCACKCRGLLQNESHPINQSVQLRSKQKHKCKDMDEEVVSFFPLMSFEMCVCQRSKFCGFKNCKEKNVKKKNITVVESFTFIIVMIY